jgi:peptidoglycan/xylan/chitin deacetylase (PgdA/CDA1 family)
VPDGKRLRVLVAVQAYNCEPTIEAVVRRCLTHVPDVMVVDDGSSDATAEVAARAGARLLRHPRNLGKGAAIAGAANETLRGSFSALLTIDGDGQHDGDDLPAFVRAHVESPGTLWVGWRREAMDRAPRARRFGNRFSNRALEALAGVRLPDTQCGLRLYPAELLRRLRLRGTRYEAEAEALMKAQALGWDLRPLPVRVCVEDGRGTSHFRPWRDTARVCASVVRHSLRRRLFGRAWLGAGAAAAHAPLAAAALGVMPLGAAAAPALAFHAAVTSLLLRPRGQGWAETETDFLAAPGSREVALTFDDGPDPEATPRVLERLAACGVPATFFVIGQRAERRPDLVAGLIEAGHAVGNHTQRHKICFSMLCRRALEDEIDQTQDVVERACGLRPVVFRSPAGHKNPYLGEVLRRRRMRCVAWTDRGFDTIRRDPRGIAERLAERARPGSILLLHDRICGAQRMIDMLPRLIENLHERSFRFVTLPGAA